MNVDRMVVGDLSANCYFLYSKSSNEAVVIDPGGSAYDLLQKLKENELQLKQIILTHGHFDHIGAVKELKEETNALVCIHAADADCMTDPKANLSAAIGCECIQIKPDLLLNDGDKVEFNGAQGTVIHTPGHSRGSICIVFQGILFSGDTLFRGSVGRTDLPGGNLQTLLKSITEELLTLDEKIIVYPGHGEPSTIKLEKYCNPFLYKL